MATKLINIIVAVDALNGIGKNNEMPWKLPKEYAHFVRQTIQTKDKNKINAVIMGRKCWESIPEKFRPLERRVNVILSRTMTPMISENVVITHDYEEALKILNEADFFKHCVETIWNIGGHDIYKIGLEHPHMHKLVMTRIEKNFDCDIFFPTVDWESFKQNNDFVDERHEEKGVFWQVTSYTKKN